MCPAGSQPTNLELMVTQSRAMWANSPGITADLLIEWLTYWNKQTPSAHPSKKSGYEEHVSRIIRHFQAQFPAEYETYSGEKPVAAQRKRGRQEGRLPARKKPRLGTQGCAASSNAQNPADQPTITPRIQPYLDHVSTFRQINRRRVELLLEAIESIKTTSTTPLKDQEVINKEIDKTLGELHESHASSLDMHPTFVEYYGISAQKVKSDLVDFFNLMIKQVNAVKPKPDAPEAVSEFFPNANPGNTGNQPAVLPRPPAPSSL